jgi:uncharacterized membrane protein (UPF0127 family)
VGGGKRRDKIAGAIVCLTVLMLLFAIYNIAMQYAAIKADIKLGSGEFLASVEDMSQNSADSSMEMGSFGNYQAHMLIYGSDSRWTISSSSAKNAVDIVWLDSSHEVIYMVQNASSTSAPSSFTPRSNARYVVEFPSGSIQKNMIDINQVASIVTKRSLW